MRLNPKHTGGDRPDGVRKAGFTLPVIASFFFVFIFCCNSFADGIYVCANRDGSKHFTNAPDSSNCRPFRMQSTGTWPRQDIGGGWREAGSPTTYDSHIHRSAKRHRISPALIKAIIRAESGFDRYAVSKRGARGLMQLMPATARDMSVADPFDPRQNIEGGTRYLRYLLDTFNGNITLALAAYNAGPETVKRVRKIPRIPETIQYVKKVLVFYQRYGGRAMNISVEIDSRG